MLTLKDIVSSWVQDNYVHQYPIVFHENVIRVYGYRSAEISDTKITCYWWKWIPNKKTMEVSTLNSADPEFFIKLQEFIEWRLKIG